MADYPDRRLKLAVCVDNNSDLSSDRSHLEHVKLWPGQRCGQAG